MLCIERDKNPEGVLPKSNIKEKSSAVLKKKILNLCSDLRFAFSVQLFICLLTEQ